MLSTQPAEVPHRQVRAQNQNLPDTLSSVLIILRSGLFFLRPGATHVDRRGVAAGPSAPHHTRWSARRNKVEGIVVGGLVRNAATRHARIWVSYRCALLLYLQRLCIVDQVFRLPSDTPFPSFVFTPRSTAPRDAATEKRT